MNKLTYAEQMRSMIDEVKNDGLINPESFDLSRYNPENIAHLYVKLDRLSKSGQLKPHNDL